MACNEVPVVWLQGGGCSGCTVSLANSLFPSLRNILLDQLLPGTHLSLLYHPTLMAGQGEGAFSVLDRPLGQGYVLAIEGAIPENDQFCTIGEKNGQEVTILSKFVELACDASLVLAVGTCSSFGGIPAGSPNPGGFASAGQVAAKYDITTPVVNVPGCPAHPDWIVTAIAEFLLAGAGGLRLDALGRPMSIYGQLIHENCPRRAYYDEGKFAEKPGDPECLHELGCKGPITYADCPLRRWNNATNWCVGAGGPCNGCTQPEYIDETTPFYQKLPEDALPKIGQA
ncbi:MAG: hydrogenase small subunit [Planctomycetes bacterium]|nr:hydrogenase small subunit [Planctomycetota bacterium]